MELPVIELTLEDFDMDRVEAIAFVDNPAIQRNWMAFNSQEFIKPDAGQSEQDWMGVCVPHYINKGDEQDQAVAKCLSMYQNYNAHKFQTHDEEKRIVAGPLMVADMPIYRNYEGKEFFVKFSSQTIEQIVNKFMAEGRINEFNKMHNEKDKLKDVFLQQTFIIDSTKGINTPNGFEALPDGSWFGYVKVNNDEIWNDYVKTGQFNGFSVEGVFSEKKQFNKENIMTKIEEKIDSLINMIGDKFKKNKFVGQEDGNQVELGSAKLTDGTEIKWEGELTEGAVISLADGSPAPDGEHTLEDGTVIAVQGGAVVAVRKPEEKPAEEGEDMNAKMSAEIEALKLENATLKSALEGYVSKEAMATEIEKVVETQKELFELVKAFKETNTDEARKDKFRQAETKMTDREATLAKRFTENKKR